MTQVASAVLVAAAEQLEAFAAALDDCHEWAAPDAVVSSPDGWAVASARRLPDGSPVTGSSGALVAVRGETLVAGPAQDGFCDALVRLHRQVLRDVLDGAVTHLGERDSEGAGLLNRQLVRGAVADVALTLSETQALLDLPEGTVERRRRVYRDLVAAGRTALKLYGARSFMAEGPGRLIYLTELLGNTYLDPRHREAEAGHE
jgi:hypothetical protein